MLWVLISASKTYVISDGSEDIHNFMQKNVYLIYVIISMNAWALSQQNLSLGFLSKQDSNHPAQLQRLARKLKFGL